MEIFDYEQGSDEWFLARRGVLTGSKFGKIITPKTGKPSAQIDTVIADLIAESVVQDRETFSSYWTDRGVEMEEEARQWYEFDTGLTVEQVGFIRNGPFGFSPDGLVASEYRGEDGMVEFKCPKASTHVRYLMQGGVPDEYKAQVHGGLIVCQREWCDFVSYHPDFRPLVVRVVPDDFTDKLETVLAEFAERYEAARKEVLGE